MGSYAVHCRKLVSVTQLCVSSWPIPPPTVPYAYSRMHSNSWQVVKHEFLYLYDIYYLQHNKDRELKWYKTTPVDMKAVKEERRKRKLYRKEEL